jgi:hypothetical protein
MWQHENAYGEDREQDRPPRPRATEESATPASRRDSIGARRGEHPSPGARPASLAVTADVDKPGSRKLERA